MRPEIEIHHDLLSGTWTVTDHTGMSKAVTVDDDKSAGHVARNMAQIAGLTARDIMWPDRF